jgi:hypothetical protein
MKGALLSSCMSVSTVFHRVVPVLLFTVDPLGDVAFSGTPVDVVFPVLLLGADPLGDVVFSKIEKALDTPCIRDNGDYK